MCISKRYALFSSTMQEFGNEFFIDEIKKDSIWDMNSRD
jgi:hypothetical protein